MLPHFLNIIHNNGLFIAGGVHSLDQTTIIYYPESELMKKTIFVN